MVPSASQPLDTSRPASDQDKEPKTRPSGDQTTPCERREEERPEHDKPDWHGPSPVCRQDAYALLARREPSLTLLIKGNGFDFVANQARIAFLARNPRLSVKDVHTVSPDAVRIVSGSFGPHPCQHEAWRPFRVNQLNFNTTAYRSNCKYFLNNPARF